MQTKTTLRFLLLTLSATCVLSQNARSDDLSQWYVPTSGRIQLRRAYIESPDVQLGTVRQAMEFIKRVPAFEMSLVNDENFAFLQTSGLSSQPTEVLIPWEEVFICFDGPNYAERIPQAIASVGFIQTLESEISAIKIDSRKRTQITIKPAGQTNYQLSDSWQLLSRSPGVFRRPFESVSMTDSSKFLRSKNGPGDVMLALANSDEEYVTARCICFGETVHSVALHFGPSKLSNIDRAKAPSTTWVFSKSKGENGVKRWRIHVYQIKKISLDVPIPNKEFLQEAFAEDVVVQPELGSSEPLVFRVRNPTEDIAKSSPTQLLGYDPREPDKVSDWSVIYIVAVSMAVVVSLFLCFRLTRKFRNV